MHFPVTSSVLLAPVLVLCWFKIVGLSLSLKGSKNTTLATRVGSHGSTDNTNG